MYIKAVPVNLKIQKYKMYVILGHSIRVKEILASTILKSQENI